MKKKKNQDAEKCYLGDVTNARDVTMLDVTIDVDTCRQAGKKKATLHNTKTKPLSASSSSTSLLHFFTDSLSKIQIL